MFSVGSAAAVNGSTNTMFFIAFHDVEGFSKVSGSYTGNGNADGPFLYTGHFPMLTIFKKTSATRHWGWYDSVRETYNQFGSEFETSRSPPNAGEGTGGDIGDYTANGIKLRNSGGDTNDSASYVYLSFAKSPFASNNRAR